MKKNFNQLLMIKLNRANSYENYVNINKINVYFFLIISVHFLIGIIMI